MNAPCVPHVGRVGRRWFWHCETHALADYGCDTHGAAAGAAADHQRQYTFDPDRKGEL